MPIIVRAETPFWIPLLLKIGGAVLWVVLVGVVYWIGSRGLERLRTRGRLSHDVAYVLHRLLRWSAIIAAIVLVLGWFGFLENAWATVTTVLALVAIGFVAVWSILSNVLCSILLLLMRPFSVGDRIELPAHDLGGTVVDFTLVFTILRGEKQELIQVPNNLFFQQPIRRFPGEMTVDLADQIDRDEPNE
jgi:small-conductance mechanosensitive channel